MTQRQIRFSRQHFESVLETFHRLAPRVGELAAIEQAMEEHDRERDRMQSARRKAEERGEVGA